MASSFLVENIAFDGKRESTTFVRVASEGSCSELDFGGRGNSNSLVVVTDGVG